MTDEPQRCDLCSSPSDRQVIDPLPAKPRLIACPGCGLVSLAAFPAPAVRVAGYQESYYDAEGERFLGPFEAVARFFRWLRFRDLRGLRVPPGAFLDIGCGRGRLVELFALAGWTAIGTQLSQTAAQAARRRGVDVRVGELAELELEAGSFSLVALYHVLEHVSAPVATLREVSRLLAPGGVVVVEVPSYASPGFRWLGLRNLCVDYPHHLYFFTPTTLRLCLDAAGLRLEKERSFSLEYSPITTLQNLLNALPGRPNRLLDALRRGPDATRLRHQPATWLHLGLAGVLAPIALLISLLGLLFPIGNTHRIYARKPAPEA